MGRIKRLFISLWARLMFRQTRRRKRVLKRLKEALRLHGIAVQSAYEFRARGLLNLHIHAAEQMDNVRKAYEVDIVYLAHSFFQVNDEVNPWAVELICEGKSDGN